LPTNIESAEDASLALEGALADAAIAKAAPASIETLLGADAAVAAGADCVAGS
jgi:hypothetical protein